MAIFRLIFPALLLLLLPHPLSAAEPREETGFSSEKGLT